MTDMELTDWAYRISDRFEAINSEYIEMMGKHIKEIGELSATDIHRLGQLQKMGANVEKINKQLALASSKTTQEINQMYDSLLADTYADSKELYNYRNLIQPALKDNLPLQGFIKSIKTLTGGTFANMSKTTNISENYKSLVDDAILKVSSGVSDYKSEIRKHLKSASAGARVKYASGNTRRLDSAVRMNILDGVRQVNQGIRKEMGNQFNADGIEISVHSLCAPDHQPIQGKQYSTGDDITLNGVFYESYDKMNSGLQRKIGTCNCQHSIFPIILGLSEPVYSNQELQDIKDSSNQKITINGKDYTKYESSQLMRKAETSMRYTKDEYIIAKASGDDVLMKQAEEKLRKQQSAYRSISSQTGLKKRYDRAYVPGYRGNGVNNNKITKTPKQTISLSETQVKKQLSNDLELYVAGGYGSVTNSLKYPVEEMRYIRENYKLTDKTLYRVESSKFTYDKQELMEGDIFRFDEDIRSFTRSSDYLKKMLNENLEEDFIENPIIFQTVGKVNHFNMDSYAEGYYENQHESLVGGEFIVVGEDMKQIDGIFYQIIKIMAK